jgi:hypothetical protein
MLLVSGDIFPGQEVAPRSNGDRCAGFPPEPFGFRLTDSWAPATQYVRRTIGRRPSSEGFQPLVREPNGPGCPGPLSMPLRQSRAGILVSRCHRPYQRNGHLDWAHTETALHRRADNAFRFAEPPILMVSSVAQSHSRLRSCPRGLMPWTAEVASLILRRVRHKPAKAGFVGTAAGLQPGGPRAISVVEALQRTPPRIVSPTSAKADFVLL